MTRAADMEAGRRYEAEFLWIAREFGYVHRTSNGLPGTDSHPILRMMGTLCYGRHKWELGAQPTARGAARRAAALEGFFYALLAWANEFDIEASRRLLTIHRGGQP